MLPARHYYRSYSQIANPNAGWASGGRTPASATDPIASQLLLALAAHRQGQSVCCFKPAYILIRYPPAPPPAPSPRLTPRASRLSIHRRPHSRAGCRAKQNAHPPRRCVRTDVSVTRDTRSSTHTPLPSSQAPLVVQRPPRPSIILNSYFHNQGQSPDDHLRVQLTGPPSAPPAAQSRHPESAPVTLEVEPPSSCH